MTEKQIEKMEKLQKEFEEKTKQNKYENILKFFEEELEKSNELINKGIRKYSVMMLNKAFNKVQEVQRIFENNFGYIDDEQTFDVVEDMIHNEFKRILDAQAIIIFKERKW